MTGVRLAAIHFLISKCRAKQITTMCRMCGEQKTSVPFMNRNRRKPDRLSETAYPEKKKNKQY